METYYLLPSYLMKNYHFISVKYLSATDTKGSRVKLTSHRLKESVTLPFDYQFNCCTDIAEAYLKEKGHPIIGQCELHNGNDGIIVDAVDHKFLSIK